MRRIPTSFNALGIRKRLGRNVWGPPRPYGDGWWFDNLAARCRIIVTSAAYDAEEWVHASVSYVDHMPEYEDLKLLHRAVFGAGWAYQVFAPPSEHVNQHEFALHLFGRLDGRPALPDFTTGAGTI